MLVAAGRRTGKMVSFPVMVAGYPVAGRAAELMRTPPKRAPCRSRLFGAVRDRPDACQLTDRITFGDRGVLEDARTSADLHALVPGSSAVGGEAE